MERFSAEPDRVRMRASDAEREEALRTLAAHYAEGRLDQPEFDQRADAALVAVTREELSRLFADLPGRELAPAREMAMRPMRRRTLPPPILLALLLALAITMVLHGIPPFPIIPLILVLRFWLFGRRPVFTGRR
jgi:hypothetical protein